MPTVQLAYTGAEIDERLALAESALQAADVDDTPADGATTAPISSGWAYDHVANLHSAIDERLALAESALQAADVDDTPADGATTAPISSNWAFDHAASDTAHGNVPVPILTGPALSVYGGDTLTLTVVDYDSYATYGVSAVTGDASIDGDTITYVGYTPIGGGVGTDTLTVTVNDHSRALTITILEGGLIDTPAAAPAIGAALEGGFYTGAIWDKVCAASGERTIGTGEHTLTVPAGYLPLYAGQQIRLAPGPTNVGQVFMEGTVTDRDATSLTVNITSVTGEGTFSTWVVAARFKIILAPKSGGEKASIQYKNANTAAPAECFTLTNGPAATAAMVAADSSTVYPLAHWAAGLNAGEGLAGYTDWYVPARDELELVWRNLKPVTNDNYTTADRYDAAAYTRDANFDDLTRAHGSNRHSDPVGAAYTAGSPAQTSVAAFQTGGAEAMTFGASSYWSSSEFSATGAWYLYYLTSTPGLQLGAPNKTYYGRARAVRRSIL